MTALRSALALLPLLAACSGGGAPAAGAASSGGAPDAAAGAASAPALDPRAVRADSARILGDAAAPVWVIEVSDYQCPFCKRWHDETFETLRREYVESGRVRFAYVHFPLPSHQHARLAAEAAMCAGAQGAFWPYHERVFEAQERMATLPTGPAARAHFDALAAAQGLDAAAFAACLDEGAVRPVVEGDLARMQQAQVNATPTFFVGDARLEGAQPIEAFRRAIDAALGAAGASPR